jgi:hypothetical protein
MLYLDEEFIAAVRTLTVTVLTAETKIAPAVLQRILACTEGRSQHITIGKVETIERLVQYTNSKLGTKFEVGAVIKRARPRFIQSYDKGVNLFVGGKELEVSAQDYFPNVDVATSVHYPSLTDVWGLLATLDLLQQEFRLRQADIAVALAVPPALGASRQQWHATRGTRFSVVLGSALVNGLFTAAASEVSSHFNDDSVTLQFTFHRPRGNKVAQQLVALGEKQGCAAWSSSPREPVGVSCERRHVGAERFLKRTWGKADGAGSRDVAVVMASSRNLVLAGHGSAGSLAACFLFRKRLQEVETVVREQGACILVAGVAVHKKPGFVRPEIEIDGGDRNVLRLSPDMVPRSPRRRRAER